MPLQPAPAANEGQLEIIRSCLWSRIHGGSINLLPDYHCHKKTGNPICLLYREPICPRYEDFPARYDT